MRLYVSLCTGYLALCCDFCRMWEKHTLECLRTQGEGDTGKEEGEGERQERAESTGWGWNMMEMKRPIWEKTELPQTWMGWFHSASTLPNTQWELSKVFLMNY